MEINDEERRRVAQRMRNEIHFMRLNREWYESEDDMVECGNRAFRDIANAVIPYSCAGGEEESMNVIKQLLRNRCETRCEIRRLSERRQYAHQHREG